jgi:1-acyl-sn-glycerol-3-phosphate acyltransferase
MRVYGLENVEAVDHSRPLLLVANHRSFFDMYVCRRRCFENEMAQATFLSGAWPLLLSKSCGMFVNLIMGWWSMYPPFFVTGKNPMPEKRSYHAVFLHRTPHRRPPRLKPAPTL